MLLPGKHKNGAPVLQLFEDMPGIADVVWAVLARIRLDHPARLVFTSAERRSGNSVLATATAIGLVQHVRVPVCLIEANVEHPSIAGYLGLRETGLSDVLDGRAELEDCLQSPRDCPNLHVLTGGTPRMPVSGEFATERMRSILERVAASDAYVIIDAPCVLDHLESRVLLQHADGALLVLRAGSTRMDAASRAQRILLEAGAPVLGSIFNSYGAAHAQKYSASSPFARGGTTGVSGDVPPVLGSAGDAGAAGRNGTHVADANGENGVDVDLDYANGWVGSIEDYTPLQPGMMSEAQHRREMELLQRRVAKLTAQLEQTEANLRRIAAAKNIDSGIASVYRTVQGLAEDAAACAVKKDLLRKIFQSNVELQVAIRRAS